MEKRFDYKGTGAGLFGNLFVGVLLTIITLGIYLPWFVVKLYKYVLENTIMKVGGSEVRFDFRGSGAELFGTWIIGVILSIITLGIYYSWFVVSVSKFFAANVVARDADGREYTGTFNGTGGALFGTMFVGTLLTIITLGIYCPWFCINLARYFAGNMVIMHNGSAVGTFKFDGAGGTLFGKIFVGVILSVITFGIYFSWFIVDMAKYFAQETTVEFNGVVNRFRFEGTGVKLFVINLIGTILSGLTFGIYWFWFMTNQLKFKMENMVVVGPGE